MEFDRSIESAQSSPERSQLIRREVSERILNLRKCSVNMKNFVNKRILIVDDEPFNLQSIVVILKLALKKLKIDEKILDPYIDIA